MELPPAPPQARAHSYNISDRNTSRGAANDATDAHGIAAPPRVRLLAPPMATMQPVTICLYIYIQNIVVSIGELLYRSGCSRHSNALHRPIGFIDVIGGHAIGVGSLLQFSTRVIAEGIILTPRKYRCSKAVALVKVIRMR